MAAKSSKKKSGGKGKMLKLDISKNEVNVAIPGLSKGTITLGEGVEAKIDDGKIILTCPVINKK